MNQQKFSSQLIQWYHENARALPWRTTTDPYRIWLSEIILQQTRVAQGLPYYLRFVEAFPTVRELASAKEKDVLRLWQGLGYYTRARNLHRCAKVIMTDWAGNFPTTYDQLIQLPGVGPYTAAAIASISFQQPVAVVDGNVFRVLARVFGISDDIASPDGKKTFTTLANKLLDPSAPDVFNQAMMEFGALHCTPKTPKCEECIFSVTCVAKKQNLQQQLPVKIKKLKTKTRYFQYFVFRDKNSLLMKPRTTKDIWHGLYDFYLMEEKRNRTPQSVMQQDSWLKSFEIDEVSDVITHVLSHQKLLVRFIEIKISKPIKLTGELKEKGFAWFSKKQVKQLPKPILIQQYLIRTGFLSETP